MKKILIVDDDSDVRAYLRTVFQPSPYQVMIASNGKEAMCIMHAHSCDLAIVDIFMPIAEGLGTIVKMHQLYPNTKIIAVSGGGILGIGDYLDHALIYGADAAMEKPLNRVELIQQAEYLLNEDHSLASNFLM